MRDGELGDLDEYFMHILRGAHSENTLMLKIER